MRVLRDDFREAHLRGDHAGAEAAVRATSAVTDEYLAERRGQSEEWLA